MRGSTEITTGYYLFDNGRRKHKPALNDVDLQSDTYYYNWIWRHNFVIYCTELYYWCKYNMDACMSKYRYSKWRDLVFFLLYARLKNGTYYAVAMSVCPSVRPSVRVFRTFLQHALRYQFETWYMHSVGGTTCRVWVASQLGQFALVYSQK